MIVAALALAGVFVALYLTLYKLGIVGHLVCTLGGCEQVNTSRWATLLGAPVALWGIGFYVLVFCVALVGTMPAYVGRRGISAALALLSLSGVVFSGWLTSLELFVIHAICQYCVVSACLVTLICLVSVADWWSMSRHGSTPATPGRSPADAKAGATSTKFTPV
jgi:uncharacterized membrane protein